jgi:hypothetical protein
MNVAVTTPALRYQVGDDEQLVLVDCSGRLSRSDLRPWNDEVASNYTQLTQLDGQTYRFRTALRGLAIEYRVRVMDVARRKKTIEFFNQNATIANRETGWPSEFLVCVRQWLEPLDADPFQKVLAPVIIGDLERFGRDDPRKLALLLLDGYLAAAERNMQGDDDIGQPHVPGCYRAVHALLQKSFVEDGEEKTSVGDRTLFRRLVDWFKGPSVR